MRQARSGEARPSAITDEPNRLACDGAHHGREAFAQASLGTMTGYASIAGIRSYRVHYR
jgi:hypothetical protein